MSAREGCGNFPKVCSCCQRIFYTLEEWEGQEFVGFWGPEIYDDGFISYLELRNCPPPCGTTLAIDIGGVLC